MMLGRKRDEGMRREAIIEMSILGTVDGLHVIGSAVSGRNKTWVMMLTTIGLDAASTRVAIAFLAGIVE